jgi:hypothetical protein
MAETCEEEVKEAARHWLAKREAKGIPTTITDPTILAGLAQIIRDASQANPRTLRQGKPRRKAS